MMLLPLLLLLLAAVLGAGAAAAGGATLRRVVVVHRHGARTPRTDVNGSCAAVRCGGLTANGAAMLEALGRAVRARYGAVLPAEYTPAAAEALSDACPRVVRSAGAFLRGVFGAAALPVVTTHHGPTVNPWSVPTFALHRAATLVAVDAVLDAAVLDACDGMKCFADSVHAHVGLRPAVCQFALAVQPV
jgi:hypothetical protein